MTPTPRLRGPRSPVEPRSTSWKGSYTPQSVLEALKPLSAVGLALVLAWWFTVAGAGAKPIGPYATRERCEQVRNWLTYQPTTECWWDGRY